MISRNGYFPKLEDQNANFKLALPFRGLSFSPDSEVGALVHLLRFNIRVFRKNF